MTLKHPKCEICKELRRVLPESVSDEMINDSHESVVEWKDFPKEVQDKVVEVMRRVNEGE